MESLWSAPHRCSLLVLGFLRAVWMAFFHHSISITHHFKIPHPFGTITQYFSHYLWAPYLSLGAAFFFFFFNITEPSEKEKRKKRKETQIRRKKKKPPSVKGKRKKKEDEETHAPNPVKKKKEMVKSCG